MFRIRLEILTFPLDLISGAGQEAGHPCLGCAEPDFWDRGGFYAETRKEYRAHIPIAYQLRP